MKTLTVFVLLVLFTSFVYAFSCDDCGNNKRCRFVCQLGKQAIAEADDGEALADFLFESLFPSKKPKKPTPPVEPVVEPEVPPVVPPKPIDNSKIWELYQSELVSFLSRGVKSLAQSIQLVKAPIAATWTAQDPSQIAQICNNVPAWGEEFKPTEKSLPEAYLNFVKNIVIQKASEEDAKRLEEVIARLDKAQELVISEETACNDAYEKSPSKERETYEAFRTRSCRRLTSAMNELEFVQFEHEQAKMIADGPNADVISALSAFHSANGTYGWTEVQGSLERFVSGASSNTFGITVTKNSKVSVENSTTAEAFISASMKAVNLTTPEDRFKFELNAPAYTVIRVGPNKWMHSSLFRKYAEGPFHTPAKYFGREGSLPMFARAFHIVSSPSVSIYVTSADAKALQAAGKDVAIGPFSGSASQMKVVNMADGMVKVTFEGPKQPVIIAVEQAILP